MSCELIAGLCFIAGMLTGGFACALGVWIAQREIAARERLRHEARK